MEERPERMADPSARKDTELLRAAELTRGIPQAGLERLQALMKVEEFPADAVLVREGDPGDALFLLTAGRAGVYKHPGKQRGWMREEQIATLAPGHCFGEMAMVEAAPRSATVRTLEATRVLRLSGEDLARLRATDPDTFAGLVLNIARTLAERLRVANMALKEFSAGELRALIQKHR